MALMVGFYFDVLTIYTFQIKIHWRIVIQLMV